MKAIAMLLNQRVADAQSFACYLTAAAPRAGDWRVGTALINVCGLKLDNEVVH
jgi:hypothetical protein